MSAFAAAISSLPKDAKKRWPAWNDDMEFDAIGYPLVKNFSQLYSAGFKCFTKAVDSQPCGVGERVMHKVTGKVGIAQELNVGCFKAVVIKRDGRLFIWQWEDVVPCPVNEYAKRYVTGSFWRATRPPAMLFSKLQEQEAQSMESQGAAVAVQQVPITAVSSFEHTGPALSDTEDEDVEMWLPPPPPRSSALPIPPPSGPPIRSFVSRRPTPAEAAHMTYAQFEAAISGELPRAVESPCF